MLLIKNVTAEVGGKTILKDFNLTVNAGEVHAIMGPNGSGKSTLSNVLAGNPNYDVTHGEIIFNGQNILALSAEARAIAGIFLAFQYPVEIPGVSNIQFLKACVNAKRKGQGKREYDAMDFLGLVKNTAENLGINENMLYRAINEGFSGGEKKRNEVLQMTLLEPSLCILDETDSGLDIDALQTVSKGVNALRDNKRSFIVITHYQRLLNYIKPDVVHVLKDGQIIKTGDKTLALELEEKGYGWLTQENKVA